MVRRLIHVPDCEGLIPTGYSYFSIFRLIYFLSYDHIVSCLF